MNGDFGVGPWLVRRDLNVISRNGTTVQLEPKAMDLLVCLAEHPGEVLPKETLLQAVWPGTYVTDDVLRHSVSVLRRAFGDEARQPQIIETVAKRGYRLIAPVQDISGTERPATSLPQHRTPGPQQRAARRARMLATGVAAMAVVLIIFSVVRLRWRTSTNGNGPPRIRSLAVLPLENLSTDSTQEYFSEGTTDALITELAQIGSIKVISRTSTARYQHTTESLPEIARELDVDGIVEGTFQRSGDRVRITTQLIYAPWDKHVWAGSYERQMQDVFGLEREVAREIAREIQTETKLSDGQPPQPRTVQLAALEAYLQGNYYLNRGAGDTDMRKAQRYFDQAIDVDPIYAPAYIGRAYSHYYLLRSTAQDQQIRRASAEKAVALEAASSDAHSTLGEMMFADWEWTRAEQELQRAIALNPNNAKAHSSLCDFFDALARFAEGLRECQIAQQLDPDYDHLSDVLAATGQYQHAIEVLRKFIERHPQDAFLHYYLYRDYALAGMYSDAILQLEQSLRMFGLANFAAQIHGAYLRGGYRRALAKWANQLEYLHASGQYFLPRLLAEVYAQLGEKDRAFYWLDQGYQQHARIGVYGGINWVLIEHKLDPLRSDRRFKNLLQHVGLPDT